MEERIRILHVDDGLDFLALTKAHLEEKDESFSVDTTHSAREGIKLLADNAYDVVLSDYQMPGMDGLKFLQHLRASDSRIPFIMLTGRGREEVAIEALNNGANHYIQKGEDIESLYETIAHVIRETVEQRRAADRLAVIEKERQTILDAVPAMIYYVDRDGNYLYANKCLADACGLNVADFIGKSTKDVFPEYGADYLKRDAEVVKSGKPRKEVEGLFETSEGLKWIKSYKTPLKDATGTVTGIIGLTVDLTKRKQVEEELKASEERSTLLLKRLPAILYTTDTELRITSVLGSGTAKTDLPPDQARGLTLQELLTLGNAPDIGVSIDGHQRALRGESVSYEGVFNDRSYQVYVEPLRDAQGTIIGTLSLGIDSTERKRAEEALRESEELFRSVVENAHGGIIIADEAYRLLYVNGELCRIMGYTREELIGHDFREFLDAESKRILVDRFRRRQKGKEISARYECAIMRKDSQKRTMEISSTVIHDSAGNVRTVSQLLDITERKQAEAVRWELEERYRRLVERSFEGVAIHNGSTLLYLNPAGAGLLGGTDPDAFIGKPVLDFVDPSYHEIVQERFEAMGNGIDVPLIEEKFIKLDGTAVDVEVVAIPLRYHDQAAMQVVFRDITARKQVVETLQESEKRFRDLTELLPQTVYELDTEGNIVYANQTGLKMFGYSKGDVERGLTAFQVFIPEDYDRVVKTMQKVLNGQKLVADEYTALRKDGTTFPVIIYGTPIMHDDKIMGVRGVVVDITERKRGEDERERFLRELEAKNREMGQFTYTVSHDLRSPLFTLHGFSRLARESLEKGKLENAIYDLKRVESAAAKMDHLLSDTLKLSRIGRQVNPSEDVPFNKIVAGALEQLATQIHASGVAVTQAQDFPTVHGDRIRIEEVLVNLIGNSIKYRGEQPSPKTEIGYRVEGEETAFFVKDNGMGIDPSLHNQVFELFFQADKRTKGTGAGLAIVKRIVEVHDGRVWIESAKGAGCTVCFTLPVR